ncbi:MAG: VCBS repeat-containing protein [Planctomycetes bacterium]|nr:VCBS repeat-containing protein [Planctomycetota bacterium]
MRTLTAFLIAFFATEAGWCGGEFPGRSFVVGQGANAVEVADFDLDGNLDALVLDRQGRQVVVLLGDGSGGLSVAGSAMVATTAPSDAPTLLAVGDFDGDGLADAAVGHGFANKVTIARNFGAATLGNIGSFPTGGGQLFPFSQLVGAELDADGLADLVIVSDHGFYVARALPGPWFSHPVLATPVNGAIVSVATRDFDGDGAEEVVAATTSPVLTTYFNDGNAAFPVSTSSPFGAFPATEVALADVDGDGKDDAFTVTNLDYPVVVRGDGSGAFADPKTLPTALFSARVEAGDINGDGCVDMVVAKSSGSAQALFGNGTGTFAPLGGLGVPSSSAGEIALGDLDADGADDLMAPAGFNRGLVVRMSNGGGDGFGLHALPVSPPVSVASTDFDADGDRDLVVKEYAAGPFRVRSLRNDGFGHFQPVAADVVVPDAGYVHELADFDADSIDDLVTTDLGFGLRIWRGLPGGGFSSSPAGSVPLLGPNDSNYKFATGDFDGDGNADLVYGVDSTNPCGCQAQVWFGDGAFGFSAPLAIVLGTFPQSFPLTVADVNADGRDDLISLGSNSATTVVAIRRGTAARTFSSPILLTPPSPAIVTSGVAAGDVDGDGKIDVVAAGRATAAGITGGLFVWKGNGAGAFTYFGLQATLNYHFPLWPRALDVDLDGDLDVYAMLTSEFSSGIATGADFAVFRNDGTGVFVRDEASYVHSSSTATLRLDRLDADGHADVFSKHGESSVEFAVPVVACPGRFESVGSGCFSSIGFAPALLGAGCPTPGATISFKVSNASPGSVGLLVLGTQASANAYSTGCVVSVKTPFVLAVPIPTFGTAPGGGYFSIEAPLPVGLPSLELDLQYFQAEPASEIGFVSSNGLRVLIQ